MVSIGKIISSGFGAARTTEASLRKLILDTKDTLTTLLAGEVKKFFSQIDIQEELAKALTRVQLEIKAIIKVVPQGGSGGGKKPGRTLHYSVKTKKK